MHTAAKTKSLRRSRWSRQQPGTVVINECFMFIFWFSNSTCEMDWEVRSWRYPMSHPARPGMCKLKNPSMVACQWRKLGKAAVLWQREILKQVAISSPAKCKAEGWPPAFINPEQCHDLPAMRDYCIFRQQRGYETTSWWVFWQEHDFESLSKNSITFSSFSKEASLVYSNQSPMWPGLVSLN